MTSIRERNKRLILRAASEEFADKGFAATKTSDIAARAGLPKPNVYYYFQSKENLYRCVLESIVEPLLQASAPFRVEDDPLLALPAYIRSKIRISRELPHASKVFASEIMHGAPHLPKEYLDELNAQAQRNVTCLQTWIDRGQPRPGGPASPALRHLGGDPDLCRLRLADFHRHRQGTAQRRRLRRCGGNHHPPGPEGCTPDGQSGKSAGRLRPLPL